MMMKARALLVVFACLAVSIPALPSAGMVIPSSDEPFGDYCFAQKRVTLLQMSTSAGARYSDEGQDEWVLATTSEPVDAKRTFLDIGARDGDFFSNTRRLEQHGWTGTCIEPFPTHFRRFNRTCRMVQKALVAKKDDARMYSDCEDGSGVTGWSGFTNDNKNGLDKVKGCTQTRVPQTTFAEIELPRVIDYASLDVEGLELQLLQSFPFDTHCAKLWTVEGAGYSYQPHVQNSITSLLESKGCKRIKQSASDGFFKCTCN